MSILLVRPYPVHLLAAGGEAIRAAAGGDVAPLQVLYREAADALAAMDPDEVAELREGFERAPTSDRIAAEAALALSETWEGIVSVGATLRDARRFRAFAWLAAEARYSDARPAADNFEVYARGAALPGVSPDDAALYAALPALIGLGPELPEELPGPCPLPGEDVRVMLGLPDEDWSGVDPVDGLAVAPDLCLRHLAGLPPRWRAYVERCADQGLLIRPA